MTSKKREISVELFRLNIEEGEIVIVKRRETG